MQTFNFKAGVVSLPNSDLYCTSQSQFYLSGDDGGRNGSRLTDTSQLEQSSGNAFYHIDAVNLSRSSDYGAFKASNITVLPNNLQFVGLTSSLGSPGIMGFEGGSAESLSNGHIKNWGDSLVVPQSTNTDGKNQALHRQAQNREAARKSRIRRKEYVQQLEDSRERLTKLEQDLKRACTEGKFTSSRISRERSHFVGGSGPVGFNNDYTRWLDEHQCLVSDLRSAVNSHATEAEVQLHVNGVMLHYDQVFRLKNSGAKSDVLHILSGMWKTPAERCFMWLGGFRSSEILKVLEKQIQPLTEQQLVGIRNLHHSSQQAEDALNQGMEALQQSLVQTLSSTSFNTCDSDSVAEYMEQMTVAMTTLTTLGNFLHQADLLRLKMLQQLQKILTTHQTARALLAFNDYNSRIRALSSLWVARPSSARKGL